MKTLNILGCGNAGRALGRLWTDNGVFSIGDVVNRSRRSASSAVRFMGAGRPVERLDQMRQADVYLIGAPDDRLVDLGRALADSSLLRPGNVVFHLSGSLPSTDLAAAAGQGAWTASVHPVKSFADPAGSVETFAGTFCGAEGFPDALALLVPSFEQIGARVFRIDPGSKAIYHAASVIVCNYLTALLELGTRAYVEAGIPRESARDIMEPIVRGTVDNVFRLDTVRALTGPIARGDHGTVARQLAALSAWDPELSDLYRRLGAVALELARAQGTASSEALAILAGMLVKDGEGGEVSGA